MFEGVASLSRYCARRRGVRPGGVASLSRYCARHRGVRPGAVASQPLPVHGAGASGLRNLGCAAAQRPAPRRKARASQPALVSLFWPSLATHGSGAFRHFAS